MSRRLTPPSPSSADTTGKGKAAKAAAQTRKGYSKKGTRIHTRTHFFKPKTLALKRAPVYERKAVHALPAEFNPKEQRDARALLSKMNKFRVVKYPLTTESAMKKIEDHNTLVFIVDIKANKRQIKDAVREMYDIKCAKVNTLIRPDGLKKAYVRLTNDLDALDIANR
mmetsp:Transcript_8612/g.24944  ORF Transcript_8612/g.24944 Transcript_8612/m.24944 type:complete len:168 (-) Transcript_8612:525-1028(-)